MENKGIKRFLLLRDAQTQLISIIEEQQRTEQGTLAHTLGADEMNVSIELHLGVWDMGTIQKYDLFRYLMAVPPFLIRFFIFSPVCSASSVLSVSSVIDMQSINSSI